MQSPPNAEAHRSAGPARPLPPQLRRLEGRWPAVAAAVLVLLAGTAYSLGLDHELRFPDERDYLVLSQSLEAGRGYSMDGARPTAFRAPGYPFVLAGARLLGAEVPALRILNFVLLAATVLLVHALGRRIAGPRVGAVAALVCAVYPFFFYTAGTFYPQTLATLLLVGAVLLALHAQAAELPRRALGLSGAAGLGFGALIVTVPSFAPTLVVVAAWLALARYPARRRAARAGSVAAMLLAAALLPAAWTARNAVAMDAFVPVATNNGFNLILGNSEQATPSSGVRADVSRYLAVVSRERMDEVEANRYLTRSALDWVDAHKPEAAALYLGKVAHYFDFRTGDLAVRGEASGTKDLLAGVAYVPLLVLLLGRLATARRRPLNRGEALLVIVYLANALVMAIWFTRLRFRLPLDALLIVVAANALVMAATAAWGRAAARRGDAPRGPQEGG